MVTGNTRVGGAKLTMSDSGLLYSVNTLTDLGSHSAEYYSFTNIS